MSCRERIEQYMRDHGVIFETMVHKTAYTTADMAASMHVSGWQVAKVVMIKADERLMMMVLPSPARLRIPLVRELLSARMVRLAKEIDFADRFPDCAIGAMPPLGNFYDVPTYVDRSLTKQKEIVFRLGSHRQSMRISWADYERLAQPLLVDIINRDDRHSPPDDLRRAA